MTETGKSAIQLNQDGETLLQKGDIELAKSSLEKSISCDPGYAEAYNNLACAYMLENNFTTALEYITRAYELDQSNQAIVLNTGSILASLGALDDAVLVFRGYLDNNPDDPQVIEKMGEIEQILAQPRTDVAAPHEGAETTVTPDDHKLFDASKVQSYFQPPCGNTEKYIKLQPVDIIGNTISSYQVLKGYEINGIGTGLDAAQYILKHIVQNKLGKQVNWNPSIWQQSVVITTRCLLSTAQTGESFSSLRPDALSNIDPQFSADEGPLRVEKITGYATQIKQGADLGKPLYVTGRILNELGAQTSNNEIYMMDGAHRISAHALAHKDEIDIHLLIHESEYKNLIHEEVIKKVTTMVNNISWFSSYQSIPMAGLTGERTLKRFDLMNLDLLKDSSVMDFGCNIGQACIAAVQAGAVSVMGVEGHAGTYNSAKLIGAIAGFNNLSYINIDFNGAEFAKNIDLSHPDQTDYSFFFSVYRTKELTQRESLFRYIINKTRKGIFFEGHAHPKIDTIEYHDWLFECFGLKYEFLGYSEQDIRPLFFIRLGI